MRTLAVCSCLLALVLPSARADQCVPVSDADKTSTLPSFSPTEFSVDIEMASTETGRVLQVMMYYSKLKNQIRLTTLDQGQLSDLYYYFADQEILGIDYRDGRGNCTARNMSDSAENFIVGGAKDGSKIQTPLGALRMTGNSGFGNDQIKVKYVGAAVMRGMAVDQYESCQKWSYQGQELVLKVTHYFSNGSAWMFPDERVVPVAIKVNGSGTLRGKAGTTFSHTYSFFNFVYSVDQLKLETPPGVFCRRAKVYPFPPVPDFIQFSAEVVDKSARVMTYLEELFSVPDRMAVMRMQNADSVGSDKGMRRTEILQDFTTGLSFVLDKQTSACSVMNITDTNKQVKLPFYNVEDDGKISQLTGAKFFYASGADYHYLGERRVRGVVCDTYVTRTGEVTNANNIVTIEWYFAKAAHTWNDNTKSFIDNKYRIPVKFRMWPDDNTDLSTDMNIYDVDYTRLRMGVFDVRACFPDRAQNHFRVMLGGGATQDTVYKNMEVFKDKATFALADAAQVLWWRVVDLQLFPSKSQVLLEFAILSDPPYAGDMEQSSSYTRVSLQQATNNLIAAVQRGLSLKAFDPTTKDFTKDLPLQQFQVL